MTIIYSDYLLIPFGIFCIIFGIYIRKKQVALRFKRTGFQLNGKEEFHSEACRYSRKKVPNINDKIVLLYSPKYEKILTKNERKKYRKITFWGFSIAVVFLLYLLHTIGVI